MGKREEALREHNEDLLRENAILRAALCLEHGQAHGTPDPNDWDKTDCDVCELLRFNKR